MEDTTKETRVGVSIALGRKTIVFMGMILGIVLVLIGGGVGNIPTFLAGFFVLLFSFIWASFFLSNESQTMRVTMMWIAGIFILFLLVVCGVSGAMGSTFGR